MRAASLIAPGVVEVDDVPDPVAEHPGDVVVRMDRASICGSDVHVVFHGFHDERRLGAPGYPGHEGVGTVVDSRSEEVAVGDVVLTVPVPALGGCFAQYQLVPDTQVIRLPADGDPERLLMAQQYGTVLYGMRSFWPPEPGREAGTAAIIGAGSAGLFFLQLARQAGFEQVVVSDLESRRLAVARDLGATTVHAPAESLTDAVMDLTGGAGADLVIEAAGYDKTRTDAIAAVAVHGVIGLYGFPERLGDAPVPMYDAFRKIARLQWAGGTQAEPGLRTFHDAVRHIHEGTIDVGYCLGDVRPLDALPEAMTIAAEQGHGSVKISVDPHRA